MAKTPPSRSYRDLSPFSDVVGLSDLVGLPWAYALSAAAIRASGLAVSAATALRLVIHAETDCAIVFLRGERCGTRDAQFNSDHAYKFRSRRKPRGLGVHGNKRLISSANLVGRASDRS